MIKMVIKNMIRMKKFLCLCALCLCGLSMTRAQQFARIYLFDDFVSAQVKFRNHSVSNVLLNYDASNKVLLFQQGEEMMEVTATAQIDTIVVGDRRLIPGTKGFLEAVPVNHGWVFIDWLLKDVNIGSRGALGAVTQGSVHNLQMGDLGLNATEMYTPYGRQKLGSTDIYRRKNDNTYYIYRNSGMAKLKTLKQVEKVFSVHKEAIAAFAEERKINPREPEDMLTLLDYCLSLEVETNDQDTDKE